MPVPETETFRIPKRRRHVSTARHRVRKTLADWGITDELADTAALLASELITNAVTHCRVSYAEVEVTLTHLGPELLLEVSDPDRRRLPQRHDSSPDEENGRGLTLVAALADTWGHRQDPHTKCVWARFTLADGVERTGHVPAAL